MRIQNINNNVQNRNVSCKSISRTVYREVVPPELADHLYGKVKYKNTSWMFRPTPWACKNIYKYFSFVFKNVNKVNVYNYGCSLGYEAYSYILWLLSGGKKNPEKFLPIIAKDYDEFIINETKNNKLFMTEREVLDIEDVVGANRMYKFFELSAFDTYDTIDGKKYGAFATPRKELTENVQFSLADIRDDYKNIVPENSIVIATNFWPYLENEERYELAENLYKQLDKGSYIRIDDFDNNCYYLRNNKSTATILEEAGFKRTIYSGHILKR